jgi:uncharacterized protein (TIGR02466 family)
MQLLELFPTIVGVFECKTVKADRPAWSKAIESALAERSQELGTPQHQTDDRLHQRQELAGLIDFFNRSAAAYMRGLRFDPALTLKLQCCWATVLHGPNRFEMHQHANSFLSGAFYLDVDEASNPLIFRDPRPQNRVIDLPVEENLRINRRYYSLGSSPGRLILFPSWLEHRVRPSYSDTPRTSLSFNMTVHGDVGSTDELTRARI